MMWRRAKVTGSADVVALVTADLANVATGKNCTHAAEVTADVV